MSLSFHDAYLLFTSEGNYRENIHKTLGYAFPDKKHRAVEVQLKRLHEKIRRQKLQPEHDVFKSEPWCTEAYTSTDPSVTVYIENLSEEEEEKEEQVTATGTNKSTPPPKTFRVNLLTASKKQQHRRTEELYKLHVETAETQQIEPHRLSGLFSLPNLIFLFTLAFKNISLPHDISITLLLLFPVCNNNTYQV